MSSQRHPLKSATFLKVFNYSLQQFSNIYMVKEQKIMEIMKNGFAKNVDEVL